MDGACFLYALANAAQAVIAKEIQASDWARMVVQLNAP